MQKSITLNSQTISYTLRRSRRARRVRLTVRRDGLVVLTSPAGIREGIAENFLREKAQWVIAKLNFFAELPAQLASSLPRLTRRDYLRYKEQARAFVLVKVAELNEIYGYSYNRISIRNQKTCWGSCSRKGNLNFNYKILFLPPRAQNYIIAHELCHLKEFNHSPRFWELVARTSPDYLAIRKELKQSGLRSGLY